MRRLGSLQGCKRADCDTNHRVRLHCHGRLETMVLMLLPLG